jgi:hypothetical protein
MHSRGLVFYSMQRLCRLAPSLCGDARGESIFVPAGGAAKSSAIGIVVAVYVPAMAANVGLRAGLHAVNMSAFKESENLGFKRDQRGGDRSHG